MKVDPSLEWDDAARLLDTEIPSAAASVDDKSAVAFLEGEHTREHIPTNRGIQLRMLRIRWSWPHQ